MTFSSKKHLASLILLTGLLSACRSDPKAPDDSFLTSLNGGAYDSQSSLGLVPLGNRTQKRVIRGRAQCNPGIDQVPLNHAKVELWEDGKPVETAYTDREGYYSLTAEILVGRKYELQISTKRWGATFKISTGPRGLASPTENEHFIDCGTPAHEPRDSKF